MATAVAEGRPSVSSMAKEAMVAGVASQRIHYLDNLRAMAMLLGVYLHAAFAYAAPSQSFWLATDPDSSVAIDASIWFIHLFRMSLFFLLSGYFAKLVIDRKGNRAFLVGRIVRIAVPFALFYPLLFGAMAAVIVFSISYVEDPKGLMGLITAAAQDGAISNAARTPTTMHLWFLYYLFMFNALSAALYGVPWLRMNLLPASPVHWLFLPLLLIPGLLGSGIPIPAPESFLPTWWPFAFYGPFYCAGWQLQGRERILLDRLMPYLWHFIALSSLLFVVYYWSMPVLELNSLEPVDGSAARRVYPVATLCSAYLSVLLPVSALLLGMKCMPKRSALLAFLADASYWTYLIHLPIVIFLQTLFLRMQLAAELKLLVVLVGTFAPCLVTYMVFVRYTPVGWLLHGKRSFP